MLDQLNALLTPPGLAALGKDPGELDPAGHELAQTFLQPLAGRAGPLCVAPEQPADEHDEESLQQLMQHRLTLLGGHGVQAVGDPIDWFHAPAGDRQWTTHLARHQWLTPLAQAYRRDRQPARAQKVADVLDDWVRRFPLDAPTLTHRASEWALRLADREPTSVEGFFGDYCDGPWTSLSAAVRVHNWSMLLALIWDAPAMTNSLTARLLHSLLTDHRQIMLDVPRQMNQYCAIACALIRLGWWYPHLAGAVEAEQVGWTRLERYVQREIYPDGSMAECSPNYAASCLRRVHQTVHAADARGQVVPRMIRRRVDAGARYMALSSTPDGHTPRLAKGGQPVGELLMALNETCRDPQITYLAGGGEAGSPPDTNAIRYPWAGHYVIRSGWDAGAFWLFFDAGPRGSGHCDWAQLGIQLMAGPHWLLADPGFYSYSDAGEAGRIAQHLQRSSAHNTATVDGLEQHRPHAPGPGPNTQPLDDHWRWDDQLVEIAAAYDKGYGERAELAVTHQRRISHVHGTNRFLLTDTFQGEGEHTCTLHWQLAPQAEVKIEEDHLRIVNGEACLEMHLAGPSRPRIQSHRGQREPWRGWYSAGYGQLEPATSLDVNFHGRLPLSIETTLQIHCP